MHIIILIKYIFGYVHVRIEGFFVERTMSQAINRKIFFWNVKKEKEAIAYANIGIKDYKDFIKIAKSNKCKVKIIQKRGFPFIFNKYRKRKVLLALVFVVCIVLFVMSNFIWNVQVEEIEKINKEEIMQELEKQGIKVGKYKRDLDFAKIIDKIRLDRADISWIGIEIDGTNAIVKIVEAEEKPSLIDDKDYCNIVSDKEAEIVKISAQNGIPVVKPGDIVTKGDMLIAGWLEGKYTGTRYVHAAGEIQAKVWYTKKERIQFNQVLKEKTGNMENKYEIKINNFTINLYKTLSKFENYDTIYTSNKLKIFSNFYLPIELIKRTNYELTEKKITYGIEEAKNLGVEQILKELQGQLENTDNILQKYVNTYAGEDYIDVEVTLEVLENIGTKEKIVFWKEEKVWKKKVLEYIQKKSFLQN